MVGLFRSYLDPFVIMFAVPLGFIGVIWMLVFGVSWIGSVGMFGWIIHIISAWCAYSYAKDHPVRQSG